MNSNTSNFTAISKHCCHYREVNQQKHPTGYVRKYPPSFPMKHCTKTWFPYTDQTRRFGHLTKNIECSNLDIDLPHPSHLPDPWLHIQVQIYYLSISFPPSNLTQLSSIINYRTRISYLASLVEHCNVFPPASIVYITIMMQYHYPYPHPHPDPYHYVKKNITFSTPNSYNPHTHTYIYINHSLFLNEFLIAFPFPFPFLHNPISKQHFLGIFKFLSSYEPSH